MTSQHKMISAQAAIPIWVLARHYINLVNHGSLYGPEIVRIPYIHELDHHRHTEREEEDVGFAGISGAESLVYFNHVDEVTLHSIYALASTVVECGWMALLVNEYLELFFHFQITPVVGI